MESGNLGVTEVFDFLKQVNSHNTEPGFKKKTREGFNIFGLLQKSQNLSHLPFLLLYFGQNGGHELHGFVELRAQRSERS